MRRRNSTLPLGLVGVSLLSLAGCGQSGAPQAYGPPAVSGAQRLLAEEMAALGEPHGVPTQFKVVSGVVIALLPDDLHGIPHQQFRIRLAAPTPGKVLEVNHNIRVARRVANLRVGDELTIRGVLYGGSQPGIHWTHHARRPGDAGFIRTGEGVVYE